MCGSGCCSDGCRDAGESDVCVLVRFVVLSVLVFFLELSEFGNGSRCRLMEALALSVSAVLHLERSIVVYVTIRESLLLECILCVPR
jgi:hypothetical protein